MDFDRTTPVDNEYKRNLSEQLERIRQEKDALEQRKGKAHEIGKFLSCFWYGLVTNWDSNHYASLYFYKYF